MTQIVFFDGVCLLCNGFVDFLLARDGERRFRFAPIQGERAKALLPPELRGEGSPTMVLWAQGQTFLRSDAVLMVLTQLGGAWGLLKIFWVVPRPLRDLGYRLVAANRYSWFGRRDTCRLPTREEQERFLA